MKFKNIAVITGIAVSGLLTSSVIAPANAAIFNVDGTNYDVTTLPANSFDANSAVLESQVWWNNQSLAIDFATAVGSYFGYPNSSTTSGNLGPRFADSLSGTTVSAARLVKNTGTVGTATLSSSGNPVADNSVYAIATPVPEPSAILGAVAGLGLIGGLKRKLG